MGEPANGSPRDLAADLAEFITAAPTPYHAVAEVARRLTEAGFVEQPESGTWPDEPGGRFLIRDGTVLAWYRPASAAAGAPMRIFAAHTDSPTLKVKPNPDVGAAGWRQVAVEVYGGALWNSWLDRDLGLAGRLVLFDGTSVLVDVHRPLLRVPQLAIHLDRAVNSEGLRLDAAAAPAADLRAGHAARGRPGRVPGRRGRGGPGRGGRARPRGARRQPAGPARCAP